MCFMSAPSIPAPPPPPAFPAPAPTAQDPRGTRSRRETIKMARAAIGGRQQIKTSPFGLSGDPNLGKRTLG